MAKSSWTPLRTCIGCRRRRPKPELIVIKYSERGFAVYPPGTKMPGRSLYLCPRTECLNQLRRRKRVIFKAQPPGRTIIPLSSDQGRDLLAELAELIGQLEQTGPEPASEAAGAELKKA